MANEVKIVVTGQNKSKPALSGALSDVQKINVAVTKIPDSKTIKVTVKDDASKDIDKVDKQTVKDKETKVTAKDEASDAIDKISNKKPKDVKVSVKADLDDDKVWGTFKDAGKTGASAFAGGFTGGLAGGGLLDAAGSLISDVFARAGEKQRTAADIQNFMGVSPEAAKAYGDRIGHMFWDGIGDSKDQITGAFGSLSSDVRNWGNLTTDQQDRIVKGAVKISSAFKVDVQEPIRAASSIVDNKLAPSFEDAFDIITKAYQTLGSRSDDALDTLQEYAGYFEQLGISGGQALGIISQGLQGGARDTDYIADAFKEFGILAIENTDKTKDALKDLGLNVKKTQDALRNGGPAAAAATEQVIEKLKQIKDPKLRDEVGIALFGTKWEDTMRQVVTSIDLGKAKLQEFKGATEGLATGAITETEKLSRAWDKFTTDTGEDVAAMINHRGEFTDAQNDALLATLGFIDTIEEETAKQYELGRSLDGTNRGFQALADTVGGYADPRFVEMIRRMSDSQLAAYGVTRKLDDLGRVVLSMPEGKPIIIDTNSGKVISDLATVKRYADALPTGPKWLTYYIDTVVTGPGTGSLNSLTGALRGRNAAGGAVVGHAAEGGARSGLTMVNERGPELLRTQQGALIDAVGGQTVVPAGQSAAIAAAAAGGQGGGWGGGPIVVQVMLDKRKVGEAVIDYTRGKIGSSAGGSVSTFFGGKP